MPSDRRGTVTEDIAGYIRRMQGSVEWKGDKDGTIRTAVAKASKQNLSLTSRLTNPLGRLAVRRYHKELPTFLERRQKGNRERP